MSAWPSPAPSRSEVKTGNADAPLASSYRSWFLEYASYVILDRAVPHMDDGLKPVQRRILHTLWEMDDGRFHKVANVTGRTMSLQICRLVSSIRAGGLVRAGSINPNTFQDQVYKYGSLGNPDPAARKAALDHILRG